MKKLSRRQFLGKSALGIGSAIIASHLPVNLNARSFEKTVKLPLGFQVWTIKDQLVKDFAGTLKMMAGLGYQCVEMCSPPGYESSGFGPLMKLTAKEMRQIINDAGLVFESTHYIAPFWFRFLELEECGTFHFAEIERVSIHHEFQNAVDKFGIGLAGKQLGVYVEV